MTDEEKRGLVEVIQKAIEAAFHETPALKEHARAAGRAAATAARGWAAHIPTTK